MSLHALYRRDLQRITHATGEFAVTARLGTHDVRGLLTREFVSAGEVEGYQPVFLLAESDCPQGRAANVRHGDILVVTLPDPDRAPARYTVRGVEADGDGAVVLRLEVGD